MEEKIRIKLAFDREYAKRVLPMLKEALCATTYSAIFRTALNVLLMVVRVYKDGHKLIEVDEAGKSIGIVYIVGLDMK